MLRICFLSIVFLSLCSISITAQSGSLNTNFSFSHEELILDHFIKGSCRNVSNIQSKGDETSIGYFSDAESILNISSGIILSTGDIRDASNANTSQEKSTSFGNNDIDLDLQKIATSTVFDATGIEFDFVPFSDQVSFKYVFASEEYCEFVNTIFNDNFGFFVSGPGINGTFENNAINVATVPGSNDFVSINTVNHESNTSSYVKNELMEDAQNCGISFGASYLDVFEFDGFTLPLTATFDVIPCETYHIRLIVGDVGDDKLDSAVFLASKSFDLGGEVTITPKVDNNSEATLYENCGQGFFEFKRANSQNIDQDLVVNFTISPLSDATEGLDFEPLPSSITIPANTNIFQLPIEVITDQLTESPERLRLELQYDCDCIPPIESDLFIADLNELEGSFEEIIVCPNQEFSIGPQVTGGAAPYQFIWNTDATTPLLTEIVDEPTHYEVTISDACGGTTLAIAAVGIQAQPTASLNGQVDFCAGEDAFLSVDFEGNPPWSIEYMINDIPQPTIENIDTNPFQLPVSQDGNYQLTRFNDAYCTGIAIGNGNVQSRGPKWSFEIKTPTCPSIPDGSISLSIDDGSPPYNVIWDVEVEDVLNPTALTSGIYNLSISDINNCLVIGQIEIPSPEDFPEECIQQLIYVPNVFSPNADGINDRFTIHLAENNFIQIIRQVQIFNRWGALLFRENDIQVQPIIQVWNGTFKRETMNPGVYIYMIELELKDGSRRIISGDLSLIY